MQVSISNDVLVQDLGGELVLLNLQNEQYFGLDDVGTLMWSALAETDSVEAACQALHAKFEVDQDELQRDLHELVKQLAEHGLLKIVEA